MKIPQLEYPIHKTYTIPYLPHVFYVGSFIVICLLVVLNVALVGSDVVTTLVSDPDVIDRPWWMPSFWPDKLRPPMAEGCQPVSLIDTQALHTNSSVSLFSYTFRRANVARDDEDPTKQMRPVPYMANPFKNCEVRSIVWTLDMPSRRMRFKSNIFCELGGQKQFTFQVPENITLAMTHFRSQNDDLGQDDMRDFLAYNTFSEQRGVGLSPVTETPIFSGLQPDSASANNVLAVLDGFQHDLFAVLYNERKIREMNNVFFHSRYIVEWTAVTGKLCFQSPDVESDEVLYSAQCGNLRDPGRTLRAYGSSDDRGAGYDLYPEFLAPFGATTTNLLIALRDAIRIDLGDLDASSNIFLNKTYFDEIIEVDARRTEIAPLLLNADLPWRVSADHYWYTCTPWTCTNGTWAERFKNLPADKPYENIMLPYRPNTPTASVLNVSYLCPTLRRKPIASILMSVFVSTVTMYNFLYAVFGFVMPKVETRYQRKRGINREKCTCDLKEPQEAFLIEGKIKYRSDGSSSPESEEGFPSIKTWKGRKATHRGVRVIPTPKSTLRYSV